MSVPNAKNRIIGLTGGIATGKSTASDYLKKKGYAVLDSDQIVADLWKHNQQMLNKIMHVFNITSINKIKEQVKEIAFQDKEQLKKLDEIIHPYVFKAIKAQINTLENEKYIFIDMPLLFEVGYQTQCDETWLIYVPQSLQIKRLMKRDHMKIEQAIKRIGFQMDIEQKKMLADHLLENRKNVRRLYHQIDILLEEYKHEK